VLTIYDVIRALIRGESRVLNDAEWVARAVQAIDEFEHENPAPAPPETAVPAAAPAAGPAAAVPAGEAGVVITPQQFARFSAWLASGDGDG
jgi:hypothetical protein